MSDAGLFAEAVDTAVTLVDAFVGWLIFLAVVASILAIAAVLCGAWGIQAVREWLDGPVAASDAPRAPRGPQAHQKPAQGRTGRRAPSWANTQPINHEEAA